MKFPVCLTGGCLLLISCAAFLLKPLPSAALPLPQLPTFPSIPTAMPPAEQVEDLSLLFMEPMAVESSEVPKVIQFRERTFPYVWKGMVQISGSELFLLYHMEEKRWYKLPPGSPVPGTTFSIEKLVREGRAQLLLVAGLHTLSLPSGKPVRFSWEAEVELPDGQRVLLREEEPLLFRGTLWQPAFSGEIPGKIRLIPSESRLSAIHLTINEDVSCRKSL